MINKLLWYDYDKPCFCSFKKKEKSTGETREKLERKRGRSTKISPALDPASIRPAVGGPGPGSSVDPASGRGVQVLGIASLSAGRSFF